MSRPLWWGLVVGPCVGEVEVWVVGEWVDMRVRAGLSVASKNCQIRFLLLLGGSAG